MRCPLPSVAFALLLLACSDDGGPPLGTDADAVVAPVDTLNTLDTLDAPSKPADSADVGPLADASVEDAGPQDATSTPADTSDAADTPVTPDIEPPRHDVHQPPWTPPWHECGANTSDPLGWPKAECVTLDAPADWAHPDGPTIELFVKRYPATSPPARGALWLLQGGPGGSGAGLEPYGQMMQAAVPDLDVYLLDHRGTGRSSRLGCAAEDAATPGGVDITPDEWPACVDELTATWGELLPLFDTTQAAHDVGQLIDLLGDPATGPEVYVYGASYGTYWGHRYLQLYPDQADGVVLDSICSPGTCDLATYDLWFDGVGREVLQRCGEQAVCQEHLGHEPESWAQAVLASLDEGHCPALAAAGIDRPTAQLILGGLVTSWWYRLLVQGLVLAIERCGPGDVDLLAGWAPGEPDESSLVYTSQATLFHVALSELWQEPAPTLEEAQAILDAAIFAVNLGPLGATLEALPWPTYDVAPELEGLASTDTPVLMLQGTLDPQTPLPLGDVLGEHLTGPHQHYVVLPDAAHGVYVQSPTDYFDFSTACGATLTHAFLEDPQAPLDAGCLADTLPLDFEYAQMMAEWLGLGDIWTDPLALMGLAAAAPELERRRVEELLRRGGP